MAKKFGPTGRHPRGKLVDHDEGELSMGVAHDKDGYVHINFGSPVKALAMPPEQAINLAKLLLKHAGASKVEVQFGKEN